MEIKNLARGIQFAAPPSIPVVTKPSWLVAYCCTCRETVFDMPRHMHRDGQHQILYVLLPDMRRRDEAA